MRFLLSILGVLTIGVLNAQHWSELDISNSPIGLPKDVGLMSNNKLFLTNDQGLCFYDITTQQYDSCISIDSAFVAEFDHGKLLIRENYKLTVFNSNTKRVYDSTNGLLNAKINGHAFDTAGNIVLVTDSGVSVQSGSSFVHDTNVQGLYISVDDLNRFYLFDDWIYTIGGPGSNSIKVKERGLWNTYLITGLDSFSYNSPGGPLLLYPNFKNMKGRLIWNPPYSLKRNVIELTYPAQIDTLPSEYSYGEDTHFYDFDIDKNGRKWMTTNSFEARLFSSQDSVYSSHNIFNVFFNLSSVIDNSRIDVMDSTIVVLLADQLHMSSIGSKPIDIYKSLSINSINSGAVANHSSLGWVRRRIPKGKRLEILGVETLYSSSLLISTKKSGAQNIKMNDNSTVYKPNIIGPINSTSGLGGQWIMKLSQQEIQYHRSNYHRPNYNMSEAIQEWKGNGDTTLGMAYQLAPYKDLNHNGIYEPQQGDYPKIKGDEAIFWITHDSLYEYHNMLYGFHAPNDSALHQSLFLSVELFNRSGIDYDSIKAGYYYDFDLGNYGDDYIACDSISNTFFVYNGDSIDEGSFGSFGFGSNIPMVGVKFLSDSMDGFVSFNNGSSNNGYPSKEAHWHNYLNSKWQDGTPIKFGGNGLFALGTTNIPTKYMYTNAGGYWSEDVPSNWVLGPNPPGDRRSLAHIPYFSLKSGESKTIETVIGYALEPNGGRLGSKDKLLNYLDSAKRFWESNILIGIDEKRITQKPQAFKLYPNPAEDQLVIQSKLKGELVQFFTMTGRLVKTERLIQKQQTFDISELTSGLYFIRIGNAVEKLVVN